MFEGIKRKIGLRQMRSEYKNLRRVGKVFNLSTAQSVALIYQCDSEEKLEQVKKYVRHLKEEHGIKKLMALGFVNEKTLPEYAKAKLDLDFFCQADLSWNLRPSGNAVRNFCSESYDILIDLEKDEIVPLRHILNKSKSRFKVGYFTEQFGNYYDFMLDVKSTEMLDYIAQVNHYLSIINKVS
ncbi:MAG: hypothetical protein K1X56_01725 [Flavobacteriales bacterium]|nr:hypothetical protein [Flavobacteriales bacterium]